MESNSPLLRDYLRWRCAVMEDKLRGLHSAYRRDECAMDEIEADLAVCRRRLEAL